MKSILLLKDEWQLINKSNQQFYDLKNLRDNISTDEIYPAKYCLNYKNIGRFALTGDRKNKISENEILNNKIQIIIGGENFGCGSAREHAAITLKDAGIKLIFAKSFNHTFRSNCTNIGIYTSINLELIEKFFFNNKIILEDILPELSGIEKKILQKGGLFSFNKLSKHHALIKPRTNRRPMTIGEKIIANHIKEEQKENIFIMPGDELEIPVDIRFSYEVFSPLIEEMLSDNNFKINQIIDPQSIILFEDHFVLSENLQVETLLRIQKQFAASSKIHLAEYAKKGSGICHTVLVEDYILPGQIIVGTDSHTGTGGVLNALCLPIGATAMANAFITNKIFLTVPETIRVNFYGKVKHDVMAKDIMLFFFTSKIVQDRKTLGVILEYGGDGLLNLSVDEMSVFTNMSIEGGAWTGVIEPNEKIAQFIKARRGIKTDSVKSKFVSADIKAEYKNIVNIDLAEVEPMVSLPSDPINAIPLSKLNNKIYVNKAFIGSCTGGKLEDLRNAARVLQGKKVHPDVQLIVHAASMRMYEEAKIEGLDKIFIEAGGKFYPSACGACIGQGPGKVEKDEVIVSATNRNYKGRMGQGDAYLTNPMVVASSAINGYISLPF